MKWLKIGSLLMFFAVLFGAFGAHILRDRFDSYRYDLFKTAILYQAVHSLALCMLSAFQKITRDSHINSSGYLFLMGILIFSGSLYIYSFTEISWFGAITPVGGLCFLLGWFGLAIAKYE